ncbi:hypothetical protein C5167_011138 [Papaver somniferum]|uniref:Uncharacterized protein n=1 Tax=Papaver somniferum TaxID=3469 RepID=A0A4Y7K283_PAPSO|nr:hypothetical protein C5167_011138 [Papaver somniferum]
MVALLDLFIASSIPVVEVLLVTGLGSFLALDSINILGDDARKLINNVVFYVFNPALISGNLSKTITYDGMVKLWFMPVNILITFIAGSAFGWILIQFTRPPSHLRGLILGCCAAGNLGNLLLIIVPAVCKEKGSPFGDPDVCNIFGVAYASLSVAIGAIYLWSYVYNLVRIFSTNTEETKEDIPVSSLKFPDETSKLFSESCTEELLPSNYCSISRISEDQAHAPLRVIQDSASLLSNAAVPTLTLIVGGNLTKGIRGSGMQKSVVIGIVVVRYILLPMLGVIVVKGAFRLGLIQSDPLYQFVLLLQFVMPPAMNIGTITQLFKSGESECSVILLWTYSVASISLTIWTTFFLWLVSS